MGTTPKWRGHPALHAVPLPLSAGALARSSWEASGQIGRAPTPHRDEDASRRNSTQLACYSCYSWDRDGGHWVYTEWDSGIQHGEFD